MIHYSNASIPKLTTHRFHNYYHFSCMKKFYTLLLFVLLTAASVQSQITINSSDLVAAGSIIRLSNDASFQTTNLQANGANQTWDYSNLVASSQRIDTFLNIFNTAFAYYTYFNLPSHRSNMAVHGPDIPTNPNFPVTITNTYAFFNKTNSLFEQTGFGADINGLSTPVGFNQNDIMYRLPMQYGNRDTSASDFDAGIPGVGSYSREQIRYNHVDGWGTLTIPLGTFPALRIVSTVVGSDSIYSSQLGNGFRLPKSTTREYKWFGSNSKLPLLQINTDVVGGMETITSITYQDIPRTFPNSINDIAAGDINFSLNPNPARDEVEISLVPSGPLPLLSISDMNGRILLQKNMTSATERMDTRLFQPGMYFIQLQNGEQTGVRKLIIR